MLDGLGSERGEQRLVDRTRPERAENDDQELGNSRQEAGHAIARLNALSRQEVGEARGLLLKFIVTDGSCRAVPADPVQGRALGADVTIAAFDAGIQAVCKAAMETGVDQCQVKAVAQGCVGRQVLHCHLPLPPVLPVSRDGDPNRVPEGGASVPEGRFKVMPADLPRRSGASHSIGAAPAEW